MDKDILSIVGQMMAEPMRWEGDWWITDGLCCTVHFFVDFLIVISMSSVCASSLGTFKYVFKYIQKGPDHAALEVNYEMKSNNLLMVVISLLLMQFGVFSIMNSMSKFQTLYNCKSIF